MGLGRALRGVEFVLIRGGARIEGDRRKLAAELGVTPGQFSFWDYYGERRKNAVISGVDPWISMSGRRSGAAVCQHSRLEEAADR